MPIIGAEIFYIINKADVLFGLFGIFHEAEECALRGTEILRDNRKQRQRHRVQRTQLPQPLLKFFVVFGVKPEVFQVLAD